MEKILIYNSGGGLGDAIQLFPLIISLRNHFKKSKFYYLGAHENHFNGKLKEYNIKLETLDLGLKFFGFTNLSLFKSNKGIILFFNIKTSSYKNYLKFLKASYFRNSNLFDYNYNYFATKKSPIIKRIVKLIDE